MATPLYKKMKNKGTSLYVFPSAANDFNLDIQDDRFNLRFSKVVALNFPKQVLDTVTDDQEKGIMNFTKSNDGPRFYNFQPGSETPPGPIPTLFSDQLVESLRNYVANYDETQRSSKLNSREDFYNFHELESNTEKIFWKWCRKLNLMDLEPAEDKINWDKNLPDFNNPNAPSESALDYFKSYLWKEREIRNYNVEQITYIGGDIARVRLTGKVKLKDGDSIILYGDMTPNSGGNPVLSGTSYQISNLSLTNTYSDFEIEVPGILSNMDLNSDVICNLDYNRFIQCIGEIGVQSKKRTSAKTELEISYQMAHHIGRTPDILFKIKDNDNYYPDLELPILPEEQQEEIIGAENLNSPIRQNPSDYPGSFYGYFDTFDKTYQTSSGDRLRKKGDYFGVLRTNNLNLNDDGYIETLNEFNSDNIDGLMVDFDTDHYFKMNNIVGATLTNFDEFSSYYFNGNAPDTFYFNALLWYYEVDDGSGNISTNLYGIEFLNNPNDDFDETDTNGQLITPLRKSVSNGEEDGLSYIFNLNIEYAIDNGLTSNIYDPTTIYNSFGFELYQNLLNINAKISDNFINIISGYTTLQNQITDLKSLIYTQTDIEFIKNQINNLNQLLNLYSTMQHGDSSTVKIEVDNTGPYPIIRFNVVGVEYPDIQFLNSQDIWSFNQTNSGQSYIIDIPLSQQKLLIISNNIISNINNNLKILLNNPLELGQSVDIEFNSSFSDQLITLQVNLLDNNDQENVEEIDLFELKLPKNLSYYNQVNTELSTYDKSFFMNEKVYEYSKNVISGSTSGQTYIYPMNDNMFQINDVVYIDNIWTKDLNNNYYDNSGVYKIINTGYTSGNLYYVIELDSTQKTFVDTILNISLYKGMKINILRVKESSIDTPLEEQFKIKKELL